MSDNVRVLLIGPGSMGKEYCKVLKSMQFEPIVIGRSVQSAKAFEEEMEIPVISGGLKQGLERISQVPTHAIAAVSINQLADTTKLLMEYGIKNILVEKPAGMDREEIQSICDMAEKTGSHVFVAYNRRFYSSTEKALQIIEEDGGVTSFHFEFTEWGHVIEKTKHPSEVKENWFLANSTHVADLAFFLGGFPEELCTYVKGSLDWHTKGSIYAGAGISKEGALFSYQANWEAPGRWGVEILTKKHRLYFKPMEELAVQEIGSVAVNKVEIDDARDQMYKPGFYKQIEAFIKNIDDHRKLTIKKQLENMDTYQKMEKKSYGLEKQ